MRIHRLRLVNFRQHEDTEVVLGAGLTGIVGPNGAGKTTMLEAIAYALYGAPAARGGKDSIRRRRAPARSQVRVEVDFSFGAHQYRVVRTLGNAELYQDGDADPVATSLAAVTERLVRLLGMTREEFFNTYFTGQKELAVMTAMTGPERAQFLSRVLGYERLRQAQERLRSRRSGLRARLATLEASLQDTAEIEADEGRARERLEDLRAREAAVAAGLDRAVADRAALQPRLDQMDQVKRAATDLTGDLKVAEHLVAEARERFGELDRQLVEALGARDRLAPLLQQLAPLPALRAEAAGLDERERATLAREGYAAQLRDLQERHLAVEARIAALPAPGTVADASARLDALLAERAAALDLVGRLRTDWVRDVQDARTKRQTLLDQYKDVKDQLDRISAAGPDGVCPTCTRPLGREFATVTGVLERQVEEIVFNGNFYKQRIEQLASAPQDLVAEEARAAELEAEIRAQTDRMAQLRAAAREEGSLREEQTRLAGRIRDLEANLQVSGLPYDRARHEAVRRHIAELDQLALQAERVRAAADRASALVMDAETAERTLSEREGRVREVKERLVGLGYQEALHAALVAEVQAAEQVRQAAEVDLARVRAEFRGAEEALAGILRRRDERRRREVEAREVAADLALHDEVDRALGDLRTDLNAALRPELSDGASAFLRDMTGGRYAELELNEDYLPLIIDDGEAKPVISGGEEDLTHLAFRLAVSQLIAERAGQPLSLLVLDEIFGSLDEERRGAVLALLRGLADRFPQVILITHIESVRDGFDRVIRVEFDAARGSATVTDETGGDSGGLAA